MREWGLASEHVAVRDFAKLLLATAFARLTHSLSASSRLTMEILEKYGLPLEEALAQLRSVLPPNATLVGQNIGMDVQWLGLRYDYESVDRRWGWKEMQPGLQRHMHSFEDDRHSYAPPKIHSEPLKWRSTRHIN